MEKKIIEEIDKEIDNKIMKLFGLDKVDEIILTKHELQDKLHIIRLIFATELMKGILNSTEYKEYKLKIEKLKNKNEK